MRASFPRAAVLACALAAALITPASANPKSDCESALEKAEAAANGSLDRSQVDKVRKSINNARNLHEQGKFKKCAALANLIVKQLGPD